jgi:mRNA-degrading endonuclease toxin of MazEF toxin-antitoxin module
MKRGEVYDARLDPVEGSEQRGSRPIVVVSRDAINESSPVVSAAPCTTFREGGLEADSVVPGERCGYSTRSGCCAGVGSLRPRQWRDSMKLFELHSIWTERVCGACAFAHYRLVSDHQHARTRLAPRVLLVTTPLQSWLGNCERR